MTRKSEIKAYARRLQAQSGRKFRGALRFVSDNLTAAYANVGTWEHEAIVAELIRLHKLARKA